MKRIKYLGMMISLLALVFVLVSVMTGCFAKEEKILLAYDSFEHEYGEIFYIPEAVCVTGEEVTIQIFDAKSNEVPVEYGACSLEKGEYTMLCTAGPYTRKVPLSCNDTTAPKIVVTYNNIAAVGQWYILPNATASDVSGVEKSDICVELYKEGQDTPIASGSGQRIRIEDVGSYILKVSAMDKEGNINQVEKVISTIVRPEYEVLHDFSQNMSPTHMKAWGGGGPVFQWYDAYDGRQGVIGMGAEGAADEKGYRYVWWTGLGMDSRNLVGATGFTIKYKAENCRMLYIKSAQNSDTIDIEPEVSGEWTEVTVSLANYDDVFPLLSNATVGLAVAPGAHYSEVCIWVDEIIIHYAPYTECAVAVENGSLDYPYDTIPEGRVVKVKHDDTKTPDGKVFSHYEYNGNRIWGDSFEVTENGQVKAVYVDLVSEEKAIPEGAVMIEDFSNRGLAAVDKEWSGPAISEWYATYGGASGVRSLGVSEGDEVYDIRWSGLLPADFAYSDYKYITFRVMLNKNAMRAFWSFDGEGAVNLLDYADAGDMAWVDIKVPADKVDSVYLGVTNLEGRSGELVWIDQIFAQ